MLMYSNQVFKIRYCCGDCSDENGDEKWYGFEHLIIVLTVVLVMVNLGS